MLNTGHSLELTTDDQWDIQLDSHGRLKECTGAYAIAQHAANAIKLFTNDAYYEPEKGIPHFVIDLGRKLHPAIIRSRYEGAAKSIAGVAAAKMNDLELDKDRRMTCSMTLYLIDGNEASINVDI